MKRQVIPDQPDAELVVFGVHPDYFAKLKQLATNLQIPLYLRADGKAYQHPPGDRIDPAPNSVATPHGAGRPSDAEAVSVPPPVP